MEHILTYLHHNKFKMLNKIRKIVFTIYLIAMLFIIIMFFLALTNESLQQNVTDIIKGYGYTLVFTTILFSALEYIYRKR